jgi:hypothetical protein
MPFDAGPSADDPPAGLTHEEREGATARAVELVALTLASDG